MELDLGAITLESGPCIDFFFFFLILGYMCYCFVTDINRLNKQERNMSFEVADPVLTPVSDAYFKR